MPHKDIQKRKAYFKAWRQKNKKRLASKRKEMRKQNLERIREMERKSYRKHKEEKLVRNKIYYLSHKEEHNQRVRNSESYLRKHFAKGTTLSKEKIPPEIVKLYKLHLQLRREARKRYGTKKV